MGCGLAQVVIEAATQRIQALLATSALEGNPCHAPATRSPPACHPFATRPRSHWRGGITVHTADVVLLLKIEPGSRGPAGIQQEIDYFLMVKKTIRR